jgi:hypothetical protein
MVRTRPFKKRTKVYTTPHTPTGEQGDITRKLLKEDKKY